MSVIFTFDIKPKLDKKSAYNFLKDLKEDNFNIITSFWNKKHAGTIIKEPLSNIKDLIYKKTLDFKLSKVVNNENFELVLWLWPNADVLGIQFRSWSFNYGANQMYKEFFLKLIKIYENVVNPFFEFKIDQDIIMSGEFNKDNLLAFFDKIESYKKVDKND